MPSTSWVVLAMALMGCDRPAMETHSTTTEDTARADGVVTEDLAGTGAACLMPDNGLAHFVVDFNRCPFCASFTASCTAGESDGIIEVISSGTLTIRQPCNTRSTCRAVDARCNTLTLSEGTYELRYGGDEIEVAWPTDETICTAPAPAI